MKNGCVNGISLLVAFLMTAHLAAAPAECADARCRAFTLTDHLAAQLGSDSAAAAWHCSASRHTLMSAREELSLRAEMERWVRANRTVGMFPEAYQFVRDEMMRLTNNMQGDTQHVQPEMDAYAKHVNATLRDLPWLLVSNHTLQEAHRYYDQYVRRRHIVRVLHVTQAKSELSEVVAYLRHVARWWAEAEARVAGDARVAVPFLPWIGLRQLIGPPPTIASNTTTTTTTAPASASASASAYEGDREPTAAGGDTQPAAWLQRRAFRFSPPRRPVPTALVYHYTHDCPACDAFGAAFDLLPLVYRRLCESGQNSIVSCSPLVLFIRAVAGPSQLMVPTLTLYGAQRHPVPPVSLLVSFLVDVDELFNPKDPFDGVEMALGADTRVVEVLVAVLRRLVVWGIVQPRFLSSVEIAELDRIEHEYMEERKRQRQSLMNTSNTTLSQEQQKQERLKKAEGLARRRGRVMTVDEHLHAVVTFHLREMWGNGTMAAERSGKLSWSEVEPLWFRVLAVVLFAVWLALLRWMPREIIF